MPTQPFTPDDLREILAEFAGIPADVLADDLQTPFTDLALDSLAIVAMRYGVEQHCGIEVPESDAHHMRSPASVIDYVNERVALGPA
jgi:acyl carrier protein